MATLIENGYPIFTDKNGDPLEGGYIFIGEAGLNPMSNPQTAYWDSALTVPAVNIRTSQGYPVYNGSPGRLYVDGNYSIVVQDKNRVTAYSTLNALDFSNVEAPVAGLDNTQVVVKSAATITVKEGSTAEVNGVIIPVYADTDLQIVDADTDYYIRLTGAGVFSLVTDSGVFDEELNGRYYLFGRILNWIIRRDASASYVARMTDPYNLVAADQSVRNGLPINVGAVSGTIGTFSGAVSGTTGTFSGAISGTTINTGNGAVECYAMNQNVRTTDEPVFEKVRLNDSVAIAGDFTQAQWFTYLSPVVPNIGDIVFASGGLLQAPSQRTIFALSRWSAISLSLHTFDIPAGSYDSVSISSGGSTSRDMAIATGTKITTTVGITMPS